MWQQQQQQHQHAGEDTAGAVDEATVCYRKVEELESFGVNKQDIAKLKTGGYHTIESVSYARHLHLPFLFAAKSLIPLLPFSPNPTFSDCTLNPSKAL